MNGEIESLEKKIERLERVIFLLLEHDRKEILGSYNLDNQDKEILANYYDEMRGRHW